MRPLLLTLAGLLVLAPTIDAQGVSHSLTIDSIAVPSSPMDPGTDFQVVVQLSRHCMTTASLLAEQVVDLSVGVNGGPSGMPQGEPLAQVTFPQFLCAPNAHQAATASVPFTVPQDAERNATLQFALRADPRDTDPSLLGAGNEAAYGFQVTTTPAPPVAPVIEEPVQEMPGVSAVVLLLGVLAAVLVARRR